MNMESGTDSNSISPEALYATIWVEYGICTVVMLLRAYSQFFVLRKFTIDDFVMLGAYVRPLTLYCVYLTGPDLSRRRIRTLHRINTLRPRSERHEPQLQQDRQRVEVRHDLDAFWGICASARSYLLYPLPSFVGYHCAQPTTEMAVGAHRASAGNQYNPVYFAVYAV